MADFNKAFDKTMGHEGGYSNDPDDAGGETYRGISRAYHPSWEGWERIDWYKGDSAGGRWTIPVKREADDALDDMVRLFYKRAFWDVNWCGEMPQEVAEEVFDTGVNMGVGRAAEFLQRALNCLNRNGALFADLVVDGRVGLKTMDALNRIMSADRPVLLKIMNVMQGQHYIEYMAQSPMQEKYARGWFGRVSIGKA